MFPDRVGRVILDGVIDASQAFTSILNDSLATVTSYDDVIKGFAKECDLAGPTRCPLTSGTKTGQKAFHKLEKLLRSLADNPISYYPSDDFFPVPAVLTATNLLNFLFGATYGPSIWSYYAEVLGQLVNDNNPDLFHFDLFYGVDRCQTRIPPSSYYAVYCADAPNRGITPKEFKEHGSAMAKVSRWGGRSYYTGNAACYNWPVKGSETYSGPWNKKLKNKIMLIGNTNDPVTPLSSAKSMERLMEGNSVLLTLDAYGHCSSSMPSTCVIEKMKKYMLEGVLPNPGELCQPDSKDFFPDYSLGKTEKTPLQAAVNTVGEVIASVNRPSARF
jgi:pimeloyl-ACP methyl ester carboxylesterase